MIVGAPEFFTGLETQLKQTPVPVLRDYLRVHLVDRFSPFLDNKFDAEHFDFYGRTLTGQKQQKERWKRALDSENRAIGMILGRLFVKEYFSEAREETLQRSGRSDAHGVRRTHRPSRLDERRDEGESARKTRRA